MGKSWPTSSNASHDGDFGGIGDGARHIGADLVHASMVGLCAGRGHRGGRHICQGALVLASADERGVWPTAFVTRAGDGRASVAHVSEEIDNLASTAGVTSDQAARLLASVSGDQAATRRAAMPPRWFLGGLSVLLAASIASVAIPLDWLRAVAVLVLLACLLAVVLIRRRQNATKPRWFAALRTKWSSALPWFVIWFVIVACVVILWVPQWFAVVPWWAWIAAGVLIGGALYTVATYTWRRWVLAASDAG